MIFYAIFLKKKRQIIFMYLHHFYQAYLTPFIFVIFKVKIPIKAYIW